MKWAIEFTEKANKQFTKLDKQTQGLIADYIDHLKASPDPRAYGKPLVGELKGLWRYRVGKYRIICDIIDRRLVIEVIKIGKRDKVYD